MISWIARLSFLMFKDFLCPCSSTRDLSACEPTFVISIKKHKSPIGLVNKLGPRQLSITVCIVVAKTNRLEHPVGANNLPILRRVDNAIAVGVGLIEQLSCIRFPFFACDNIVAVTVPAPRRRKEDRVDIAN